MIARTTLLVPLLLAVASSASCRGRSEPASEPSGPGASSPHPPRADQVRPGELAEGSERAFGLPIPRKMRVTARFSDAVFAAGPVPREDVANYVRERVTAEGIETGPAKTVFANAKPKGDPQHMVRIEVMRRGANTELVVRDRTRPPPEPGLTPEERMKKAGLTPDGKLLDPKRLE